MIFGLDRYYWPITIPAGAQIVIKAVTISLTAGTYYAHTSAGTLGGHPSFYAHLCARLATVYGGTWTVDALRPPGYSLRSGVRLKIAPGSGTETINLSTTTPIVKQLLGFDSAATGVVAFASNQLDGPRAAWGSWCPWSLFDGRAADKNSYLDQDTQWSSDAPEVATPIIWRQRRLRVCNYPLVYGATINARRATIEVLAEQAGLGLDDTHNALEHLWAAASLDLPNLLVTHDAEELDLTIPLNSYDIAKLATRSAAGSMQQLARRNGLASDLWDVTIPLVVTGGSYGL